MFRKFVLLLSVIGILGIFPLHAFHVQALSHPDKALIEIFERDDCKHCQDLRDFLGELAKQRDDFQVNYYDIYEPENRELWKNIAELEGIAKVTPIILIGDTLVEGFSTAETSGAIIERLIDTSKGGKKFTFSEFFSSGGSGNVADVKGEGCSDDSLACDPDEYEPLTVNIPFYGPLDVKRYSLATLSIILGFIDGFNPCAMWVLVTFILILIQIGDRKKMWQIAGLFILAEAIMYYLILNVWFKVWDFVGLDNIVTPIVGIIAIGGGLFFLYEWKKSDGTCKVTNLEQRQKTRSRIEKIAAAEMTLVTIFAVIGLALSVNIIEFACSIGIPQAFTKILDINELSFFMRHFYMLLYIIFYMVDDLIVFGIALYSIEKIGLTTKYSKWCNLIGGILMLILGAILILKPEMLVV